MSIAKRTNDLEDQHKHETANDQLTDEELHSLQVSGPGRLHERRPPALAQVLQLGPRLQEERGHLGVAVLAGVGQGGVAGVGAGVAVGGVLKEVADEFLRKLNSR